tara:strand:- start:193 stop:426 length:234 start_codon:yes stop_codon:yes gene_type:complete
MATTQIDRTAHLITDIAKLACGKNAWKPNSDGSGIWQTHNMKYVDCPKCLRVLETGTLADAKRAVRGIERDLYWQVK